VPFTIEHTEHTERIALRWWAIGVPLALGSFYLLCRLHHGKVPRSPRRRRLLNPRFTVDRHI
jgi:hypothetical protein